MRRSRFTEEQIVGLRKKPEAGLPTGALCRQHGISEQTFYRWKHKYRGLKSRKATRPETLRRLPTRSGGPAKRSQCAEEPASPNAPRITPGPRPSWLAARPEERPACSIRQSRPATRSRAAGGRLG
jgi:putative transposase